MLITQEMIYNKLTKLEKDIELIKDEKLGVQIKEYSENKASKLLGIGQRKLKQYVKDGLLLARLDKNGKSKSGFSLRFTHEELKRFQQRQQVSFNPEFRAQTVFDAKKIVKDFHTSRKVANNG